MKPNSIPKNYAEKSRRLLCEKELKIEDKEENPAVRNPCHPTGVFRGLAHDKYNLSTQKKYVFCAINFL